MLKYSYTQYRQVFSVVLISMFCLLFGCKKTDVNIIDKKPPNYDKVVKTQPSEVNEKEVLKNSYFGDFSNCKILKKKGRVTLERWKPGYEYYLQNLPQAMYDVTEKDSLGKLDVKYDEIWIAENEDGLSEKEKIEWKGRNEIIKLYWKDNKIQAYVLLSYYTTNPLTDKKLPHPSHEIRHIYDRSYIIKHPKEF